MSRLDSPGSEAFAAVDKVDPQLPIFARIVEPNMLPNIIAMEKLSQMNDLAVLKPIKWGTVNWPQDQKRRFAVIFPQPVTKPLSIDDG